MDDRAQVQVRVGEESSSCRADVDSIANPIIGSITTLWALATSPQHVRVRRVTSSLLPQSSSEDHASWLFLRHAESNHNALGIYSGHIDVALSPGGKKQAMLCAEKLAMHSIKRILTSDLKRATQTAECIARANRGIVQLLVVPNLRERHLGALQGTVKTEAESLRLHAWDYAPLGGESRNQVIARVLGTLAQYDELVPTLVLTHGTVLESLLGFLGGWDREIGNAEGVEIRVLSGTWSALMVEYSEQLSIKE